MKQGPSFSLQNIQVMSAADEFGLRLNEFQWILNSSSSIIERIVEGRESDRFVRFVSELWIKQTISDLCDL